MTQVVSFLITSLTKLGDSFASPIFRAKVKIVSKHADKTDFSFILKVPSLLRPINEDVAFENEMQIYSSTLEEMHRLLKHSGYNASLGPR